MGILVAVFLAASPGMFHAGVSFLPQSFSMCTLLLSFSYWLDGGAADGSASNSHNNDKRAIFWMGASGLMGWPFCVLTGIPMGLDLLWRYRANLLLPLIWAVVSAAVLVVPSVLVDYYYYREWLVAVINIAHYNFRTGADAVGAALYGVEPWTYYVFNLILNFNIVSLFMAAAPVLAVARLVNLRQEWPRVDLDMCTRVLPALLIWLALMFSMPHKEERFLYVVYPLMCLSAAYAFVVVLLPESLLPPAKEKVEVDHPARSSATVACAGPRKGLAVCAAIVFGLMSLSRNLALCHNYGGALRVHQNLHSSITEDFASESGLRVPTDAIVGVQRAGEKTVVQLNVCYGKEWYRFPSHFFLPSLQNSTHQVRMQQQFLLSDFSGLLPKAYAGPHLNASSIVPTHMNNLNKREPSRYIDVAQCHYIVDFDLESQNEPHYYEHSAAGKRWEVVHQAQFLDAARSPRLSRAFFVPGEMQARNVYRPYQVLRRHP